MHLKGLSLISDLKLIKYILAEAEFPARKNLEGGINELWTNELVKCTES